MADMADNLFNDDSISDQMSDDQERGQKGGAAEKSDEGTVAGNLYNDNEALSDQLWGAKRTTIR